MFRTDYNAAVPFYSYSTCSASYQYNVDVMFFSVQFIKNIKIELNQLVSCLIHRK